MAVSAEDAVIGNRYRLIRLLATGGMGAVWEAEDERLHRTVAVKQLQVPPELHGADREAAVRRAMREARLTARLHHPNAIQVYDIVVDDGQPSLVMQYVPSTSLHNIVRERGPLPEDEVARIGTQIAAALAAAHRAGIVHRDVKPGNVLIAVDDTAKITDFGISHALDDVTVTTTGMVTGTPAYIAPEVARGLPSSFASDVYSLGATLYMAVEGRAPFGTDQNAMAVLHRVAAGQPDPMVHATALAPIVQRMMAREPADRPDMVSVANALGTFRVGVADELPDAPTTVIATDDRTMLLPEAATVAESMPAVIPEPAPLGPPPLVLPATALVGPPERQHRSWVPIAAAAFVVAIASVLAIVLISANTGGGPSGSGAPANLSPIASGRSSTSQSATQSAAQTGKQSTPPGKHGKKHKDKKKHKNKHRKKHGPKPPGPQSNDQLAKAIEHYYSLVPGDLHDGWNLLTPRYQQSTAGGRGAYNKWWHSIDSVEIRDVTPHEPNTVAATLTYHFKNGRSTTERTQFGLVNQGGTLLIDSSRVIG